MRLVDLMQGDRRWVTVVGDDAQSIYRFRGASGDTFQLFKAAYDHLGLQRSLCENYRWGRAGSGDGPSALGKHECIT